MILKGKAKEEFEVLKVKVRFDKNKVYGLNKTKHIFVIKKANEIRNARV